ncbi:MAG: glyoxalase [Bacteroidetes bacterium]|nr:glyoxalase [Bacteroidota bacterium]
MSDLKIQLRPEIPGIELTLNFSEEERFQNEVLRPIIKLQNDLILSCFVHYLQQTKGSMESLNPVQIDPYITNLFKTSTRLKTELRGLIIGLFTLEEYHKYIEISSQLNRRMNNMIQQRILSFFVRQGGIESKDRLRSE